MNILILGCGYIGAEAALLLKKRGHSITATTRNPDRLEFLSKIAHKSSLIQGNDEGELAVLMADHDAVIVTIGADSADQYETAYLNTSQMIRHLALEMDLPKRLIYTSSTSVYGDHHGQWVDEESDLLAQNEGGKVLIETEKQYLSLKEMGWGVAILRLSEIYGPGRELSSRVKELEGKTLPGLGNQYTNMVHRRDCGEAIDYALRHHLEGIYNLADDEHPSRKELYDAIAHKFKLPPIHWDPSHSPIHKGNKRISNHKIKKEGFAFHYPLRVLD